MSKAGGEQRPEAGGGRLAANGRRRAARDRRLRAYMAASARRSSSSRDLRWPGPDTALPMLSDSGMPA